MSNKVAQIVTEQIIEALEQGIKPWVKPWKAGVHGRFSLPQNYFTQSVYSGINLINLSMASQYYQTPYFVTAKQASDMAYKIRKGEHGTPIVWLGSWRPKQEDEQEDKSTIRHCLRYYTVFNLEQLEGFDINTVPQPKPLSEPERIAIAENILTQSKAIIVHNDSGRASYSPELDRIRLPHREAFTSAEGFYATALHELTHWTGHPSRLNRDFANRFGNDAYAFEELIAEMGSAMLTRYCGIDGNLENHASYIGGWLQACKDKPNAFIEAASKASKAFEYVCKLAGIETGAESRDTETDTTKPAKVKAVKADDKPRVTAKASHGTDANQRQALLDTLTLQWFTAHDFEGIETFTVDYAGTTYNIHKNKRAIEYVIKALGFGRQLAELKTEAAQAA